ncbi:MAG: hypothetical protein JWP58_771 [Hymenobacter sp.]|nr:hypothetical protein [Hymenobacter sp.]
MLRFFTSSLLAGRLLLVMLLAFAQRPALAQAPAWQSVFLAGQTGATSSSIGASASDALGNVYLTGYFSRQIQFGATTLTSRGAFDVFVAKWNHSTSSYEWAVQASGGAMFCNNIAVSGSNVYILGTYSGTAASFGTTTLPIFAPKRLGINDDLFVAKIVDQGPATHFAWALRAGSPGNDNSTGALAVSGNNVYITGRALNASIEFDGATPITLPITSPSSNFIAKIADTSANPGFVWAQSVNGSLSNTHHLAAAGSAVYWAGSIGRPSTFDNITLSPQGSDMVVAKLVDAGASASYAWAVLGGGTGSKGAYSLALNGSSIYVAGVYNSAQAQFGGTVLTNASPGPGTGLFWREGFVAKLTEGGGSAQFNWAQPLAVTTDRLYPICLVSQGTSIYAAGYFQGTLTAAGTPPLTGAGNNDGYVARLTDAGASGRFDWTRQIGGTETDDANGVTFAGNTVYVAGSVMPGATFGSITATGQANYGQAYLASFTDLLLTATAPALRPESLALFPNPAHGHATIQLPAIPGTATATLAVLDALGRTLRTQAAPANARTDLDLTGLPAGLYAVRVQAGGSTATRRLVVE